MSEHQVNPGYRHLITKGVEHLDAVLHRVESVSALDISFLLTHMDSLEFMDVFEQITTEYKKKTGQELKTEIIINIDDPDIALRGGDKINFLRFLKALRENSRLREHISDIVVKGPKGTVDIEPNVFASGVRFVEMNE